MFAVLGEARRAPLPEIGRSKYAGCEKSCIAGMVFKRCSEELSSAVRGVDEFNTSVTWRNSATFVTC